MPRYPWKLNAKKRQAYNSAVTSTRTAHKKVKKVQDKLHASRKEPLYRTPTNRDFAQKVGEMVEAGDYIRTQRFIFPNVEHLHNRTIKNLLGEREPSGRKGITRKLPDKTRVTPYQAALIAKMIVKGISTQKILEHYPQYRPRQISRIRAQVAKGRRYDLP